MVFNHSLSKETSVKIKWLKTVDCLLYERYCAKSFMQHRMHLYKLMELLCSLFYTDVQGLKQRSWTQSQAVQTEHSMLSIKAAFW